MAQEYPLVVFSHLRWDFVFQRPQHLLSRLAHARRVLYIEEPVAGEGPPQWQRWPAGQGVTVFRPQLPAPIQGFHEEHHADLITLMRELTRKESLDPSIAWLYTPMALPMARALLPAVMVYDCMDELSLFHGAPPQLLRMESELLVDADLVFTGGPSLFHAKKDRHPDVHCFPSSVDARHFQRARPDEGDVEEPEIQRSIAGPRLGFYGVIDERLDLELLDSVARARPEWQIVLVGPVVKIDPARLPRHSNLHYFGQQAYADLPGFLSGWDVCLLPFALNDATRFISPTKTLEYMAAERPIVSTPIRDVVDPYSDTVFIAGNPDEFIAAVDQALAMSARDRKALVRKMRAVVAGTSWESTAEQMNRLLTQRLETAATGVRRVVKDKSPISREPDTQPSRKMGLKV